MFISFDPFLEVYSNKIVIIQIHIYVQLFITVLLMWQVEWSTSPKYMKYDISLFFKMKLNLVEASTNQEWWEDVSIPPPQAGFEDHGRAFWAMVESASPSPATRQARAGIAHGTSSDGPLCHHGSKSNPYFSTWSWEGPASFPHLQLTAFLLLLGQCSLQVLRNFTFETQRMIFSPKSFSFHLGAKWTL